jgi:flagellar FliL protein
MADEEKAAEGSTKKSKLPLIIGIVVVVLLALGGGAFFLMGGQEETEEAEEVAEIPQEYDMLELEPFYVNLSETNNYLKLVLSLQYNKTQLEAILSGAAGETKEGGTSSAKTPSDFLDEKRPILRDSILQLLSSKTLKDVLSAEGKELMKEELLETLNESLEYDDEIFVRVLFLDFLVQ